MAALRNINTKDLEFLLQLDKKLHSIKKCTFTPNMRGHPFEVSIDNYTDESMTAKETQGVLEAVERGDFALYPINTDMGFAVGFRIENPDPREALLTFKESQLPKGYDFNRLSEYFMKPENIERAKSLGVSIINNRDHYDY